MLLIFELATTKVRNPLLLVLPTTLALTTWREAMLPGLDFARRSISEVSEFRTNGLDQLENYYESCKG